jgi:tRNA dimethylallyltransferase
MNKDKRKQIYFVIGPTSSGKTDIAIDLVKSFGFDIDRGEWRAEIVGADSRQIFRDFDLTTGKATEEELNLPEGKVEHHMMGCVDPGTYFSVVDYQQIALTIIEDIWSRGKVPIVCGGTGQYIDAIYYDERVPEVLPDEDFRKEMEDKSEAELYEMLKVKDERRASKIDRYNKVRLIRALEIINKIGIIPERQIKERFVLENYGEEVEVHVINTSRKYDRDMLRERVEARFRRRIDEGMIEEVRNAKEKYNLSSEYLEKLGLEFRYVSQYLESKISYELMIDLLVCETRKYARRQETYFRKYKNTDII